MVIYKMADKRRKAPVRTDLDIVKESKKPRKLKRTFSQNASEPLIPTNIITEISEEDLNELQTVYKNCREVIQKIELKYGHLLDKSDRLDNENTPVNVCTCTFNKKIVFNDDGQQITENIVPDLHVCPKKPRYSPTSSHSPAHNVLIEHDVDDLPNNLKELCEILKDPKIGIAYRNKVIEKIRSTRLDNNNIMRFDRKFLIQKLKKRPDFIEFKGANMSSLPGYPVYPIKDQGTSSTD